MSRDALSAIRAERLLPTSCNHCGEPVLAVELQGYGPLGRLLRGTGGPYRVDYLADGTIRVFWPDVSPPLPQG